MSASHVADTKKTIGLGALPRLPSFRPDRAGALQARAAAKLVKATEVGQRKPGATIPPCADSLGSSA